MHSVEVDDTSSLQFDPQLGDLWRDGRHPLYNWTLSLGWWDLSLQILATILSLSDARTWVCRYWWWLSRMMGMMGLDEIVDAFFGPVPHHYNHYHWSPTAEIIMCQNGRQTDKTFRWQNHQIAEYPSRLGCRHIWSESVRLRTTACSSCGQADILSIASATTSPHSILLSREVLLTLLDGILYEWFFDLIIFSCFYFHKSHIISEEESVCFGVSLSSSCACVCVLYSM